MQKSQAAIATKCWRLDSADRTAVFADFGGGCPALVHFGRKLPAHEPLDAVALMTVPAVAGGQLDPLVPLTLIPGAMTGWQGQPGLIQQGALPNLKLKETKENDKAGLCFIIADQGSDTQIEIKIELCLTSELLSLSVAPIGTLPTPVDWLALSLPVPAHMPRILDHGGRWCGEFRRQESRFVTGQYVRESQEGRTGHAHFPGVVFLAEDASKTSGDCMAVSLCWSGGHKMLAEELPDGRRHVQFGIASDQSVTHWELPSEIRLAWSGHGLNGLAGAMISKVRNTLPKKVSRPVHYNCWEAIYFDHKPQELMEIATIASELGAERFVLDDGWFKGRNDDTTSLGDWVVDTKKYPDGLSPLVDHVLDLGMEFGIWFEPEMVNKDSDLYRAHPEWVLGSDAQPSGRHQYVLDLSQIGVCDYLFEAISKVLSEHRVTYIKWDHNRILTGGAPQQTQQLYNLMGRINDAFPHVEIESCSSGGGRIDYGVLQHTTRVWLSDSNDAQERLRMQHEASQWVPPEVQGSHVGPRHCHTSGRVFSMDFRAWVAAQRHMGFEMDPREITDEERATLKRVTHWYRANRDFLFAANHHRLESCDSEVFAEIFVSPDQERFILFKGQAGPSQAIAARAFNLVGLDPETIYELHLANPEVIPAVLNRYASTQLMNGNAICLSGAALMAGALRLPNAFPASMFVIEGRRAQ